MTIVFFFLFNEILICDCTTFLRLFLCDWRQALRGTDPHAVSSNRKWAALDKTPFRKRKHLEADHRIIHITELFKAAVGHLSAFKFTFTFFFTSSPQSTHQIIWPRMRCLNGPPVCLPACLPTCLSVCLPTYPSVCLSSCVCLPRG